jgi:MFS superfamily sulfate permease-like transporter
MSFLFDAMVFLALIPLAILGGMILLAGIGRLIDAAVEDWKRAPKRRGRFVEFVPNPPNPFRD